MKVGKVLHFTQDKKLKSLELDVIPAKVNDRGYVDEGAVFVRLTDPDPTGKKPFGLNPGEVEYLRARLGFASGFLAESFADASQKAEAARRTAASNQ
jgi:hypothetical protein